MKQLLLLSFLIISLHCTAQTYDAANEGVFDYYSKLVGKGASIFNGPEYTGGDATVKGHQFYPSKGYTYGTVVYRGFQYDSVILNYDAVADQLVLVFSNEGEFEAIVPDQELVTSFHIPGMNFINYQESDLAPGYYELLYDGPTQVLAKRNKDIVQANEKDYLSKYAESHRYYMWVDDTYVQIRSRNTLLNLFKDQKSEIKAFARSNRLIYKDAPARYITLIAEYLDSE